MGTCLGQGLAYVRAGAGVGKGGRAGVREKQGPGGKGLVSPRKDCGVTFQCGNWWAGVELRYNLTCEQPLAFVGEAVGLQR